MLTNLTANQYGTPVAEGCCDTCGRYYTVVPIPEPEHWRCWNNCLRPDCDSYDITRDADLWFDLLTEHDQVVRRRGGTDE
jgi:hypothetical protein